MSEKHLYKPIPALPLTICCAILRFFGCAVARRSTGTLERANSYALVIGTGAIWLAILVRGKVQLEMPATGHWGEFLAFNFEMGIVASVTAWLIIFGFRFLGSAARLYSKSGNEIAALNSEILHLIAATSPTIKLTFEQEKGKFPDG